MDFYKSLAYHERVWGSFLVLRMMSCRSALLRSFFAFGLSLGALTFPHAAFSQAVTGRYSEAEEAGFAFYTLTGLTPKFETWIKITEAYHKAIPVRKAEMLNREKMRLQQEFINYTVDDSVIQVSTKAVAFFGADPKNNADRDSSKIEIRFNDKNGQMYFPFPIGESWIAAVSNGLQNQKIIDMGEEEYQTARAEASNTRKAFLHLDVEIDLDLRPKKADSNRPYNFDGIEAWLLMCDILSFEIWTVNHTKLIWKYEAPNYISERRGAMMGLFGR